MSEVIKKVSKEADNQYICAKLRHIGNVFLTKREVSTHEAIIRLLSRGDEGSRQVFKLCFCFNLLLYEK